MTHSSVSCPFEIYVSGWIKPNSSSYELLPEKNFVVHLKTIGYESGKNIRPDFTLNREQKAFFIVKFVKALLDGAITFPTATVQPHLHQQHGRISTKLCLLNSLSIGKLPKPLTILQLFVTISLY